MYYSRSYEYHLLINDDGMVRIERTRTNILVSGQLHVSSYFFIYVLLIVVCVALFFFCFEVINIEVVERKTSVSSHCLLINQRVNHRVACL